jgi:diguanylate cyclase (GGDEF)-like protein
VFAAGLAGYALGAAETAWLRRQLTAARDHALHDPLTGLPNRRATIADLQRRRNAGPILVALIDLNHFKTVNDTYGHTAGDDLLATVAARLRAALPPDGFAARLGGDEFLLLLPHDSGRDPTDVVTPVLARLAQPVQLSAATLRPQASAGITTTADGAANWRHLTGQADAALYRAKNTGTGVAVYDPRIDGDIPNSQQRPHIRRRDHHHPDTGRNGRPDLPT